MKSHRARHRARSGVMALRSRDVSPVYGWQREGEAPAEPPGDIQMCEIATMGTIRHRPGCSPRKLPHRSGSGGPLPSQPLALPVSRQASPRIMSAEVGRNPLQNAPHGPENRPADLCDRLMQRFARGRLSGTPRIGAVSDCVAAAAERSMRTCDSPRIAGKI